LKPFERLCVSPVAFSLLCLIYLKVRGLWKLLKGGLNWIDFKTILLAWFIVVPTLVITESILEWLILFFGPVEFPDQIAVKRLKEVYPHFTSFVCLGISIVCVVPFIEELLFRGLLQGWLRTKVRPMLSIILASGAFALAHYSPAQGVSNLMIGIPLFFLSSLLGGLYERRKTLWVPIVLHGLFNLTNFLLIWWRLVTLK